MSSPSYAYDWTSEVRTELREMFVQMDAEAKAHQRASVRCAIALNLTMCLSVVLGASATVFAVLGKDIVGYETPIWMNFCAAIFPVVAASLTPLFKSMGWSELPAKHKAARDALIVVRDEVRRTLALPPDTREAAATFVCKVQERYSQIAEMYPIVSVPDLAPEEKQMQSRACPDAETFSRRGADEISIGVGSLSYSSPGGVLSGRGPPHGPGASVLSGRGIMIGRNVSSVECGGSCSGIGGLVPSAPPVSV